MPPPIPNRRHRELCGVTVHAYTHPAFIASRVVDPVGNPLAQFLVLEIMDAHAFRLTLGLPLSSPVFEISDQFLFLRIHRNHRLPAFLELAAAPTQILKLLVAIGVLACSFLTLLQSLQTVFQVVIQNSAVVFSLTDHPCCFNSWLILLRLFELHFSAAMGSPRVAGSTICSMACITSG